MYNVIHKFKIPNYLALETKPKFDTPFCSHVSFWEGCR